MAEARKVLSARSTTFCLHDRLIYPSSLTKFSTRQIKDTDLIDPLICKTVSIAIEKGIIRSNSMIGDTTQIGSRSNPLYSIEVPVPP